MEEISVFDYSTPVHKVLLEPNLLLGIGLTPAMLIMVLTIVLMNIVTIWCVIIGIFLYVIARMVCKNDPYALTVLLTDFWLLMSGGQIENTIIRFTQIQRTAEPAQICASVVFYH